MTTVSSQLKPLTNPHQVYKRLGVTAEQIAEFCQQWKISELALFGSVLRDDFNEKSDIDILVTFRPEAKITFFDLDTMEEQLKELSSRDIDIISKRAIENSHNWIRRRNILGNAEVLYVG